MVQDEMEAPPRRLTRMPSGYRSGATLAEPVRWGTAALTVLCGLWLGALVTRLWALGSGRGIGQARDRVADIQMVLVLLGLVTGLLSILWLRRLALNLSPLGVRRLRFGPGWVVGGWLVPVLNAIRPKQVVDDIWRATEVEAPDPLGDAWRTAAVPGWIHLWWGLVVAAAAMWLAAGTLVTRGTAPAVAMSIATALLGIGAGSLFLLVVARMTERQDARARYLEVVYRVWRGRLRSPRSMLVAPGAIALVLALGGAVLWPVSGSEVKFSPSGAGYLGSGVSFSYPFSYRITEAAGSGASTGQVTAARGTDSVVVEWFGRGGTAADIEALSVILDDTIRGTVPLGSILYRGRPVLALVGGGDAIFENFSVSVGNNQIYGKVAAANCAASDRIVVVTIVADTSKALRKALSTLVVDSVHC